MTFAARTTLYRALSTGFGWDPGRKSAAVVLSSANRVMDGEGFAKTTTAHAAGKWYFEATLTKKGGGSGANLGIATAATGFDPNNATNFGGVYTIYRDDGVLWAAGGNAGAGSGIPALAVGDVVGVAADLDGLQVRFYRNGVLVTTQAITAQTYYGFGTVFQSAYSWTIPTTPLYMPGAYTWWGS